MLQTVTVGRHQAIQGAYVRTLPNGLVVVRVGDSCYAGNPVRRAA